MTISAFDRAALFFVAFHAVVMHGFHVIFQPHGQPVRIGYVLRLFGPVFFAVTFKAVLNRIAGFQFGQGNAGRVMVTLAATNTVALRLIPVMFLMGKPDDPHPVLRYRGFILHFDNAVLIFNDGREGFNVSVFLDIGFIGRNGIVGSVRINRTCCLGRRRGFNRLNRFIGRTF